VNKVALKMVKTLETEKEQFTVTRNEIYGAIIQSLPPINIRPMLRAQSESYNVNTVVQEDTKKSIHFNLLNGPTAHCWALGPFQFLDPTQNP
jgi:hypothetical protein